jgi:hypothetical protein
MRSGIFISALFATALVGSTALADRNNDYDSRASAHARDIKERVLDKQKEGFGHVQRSESTKNDSAAQKKLEAKTNHNAHGDTYEQYGKSKSSGATHTTTQSSKATKAADKFSKRGENVDSKGKGSSRSNMGKQVGWSAGGKSIRSYVHSVNDKGELNNQIHGSTASAMKARHVANVLMKTALGGRPFKMFSWQGSGGDASESLF